MIDFDDMKKRQEAGLRLIDTLVDEERRVLQHYCSLATEALLLMGTQRKAPFDEVVLNAYKNGIAQGIMLTITNGEIQGRV